MKPLNEWWCSYSGEKIVLISDEGISHKWIGSFFFNWADCYYFIAEIKEGSIKIRPKRVFVTSNYSLHEIFDGQILAALQDRFDIYNFVYDHVSVSRRKPIQVKKKIITEFVYK